MYKDVGMAACQKEQKQGVEVVVCEVARMMIHIQQPHPNILLFHLIMNEI